MGIADIPALFDHFVGAGKQRGRHSEAEYLGGLRVNDHPLRGRAYRQALGPRPAATLIYFLRRFGSLAISRSSYFDANEQNAHLIDVDIIVESLFMLSLLSQLLQ